MQEAEAVEVVEREDTLAANGQGVSMEDIGFLGEKLQKLQKRWRRSNTLPVGQKHAPVFNATQLAELCGKTVDQMTTLLKKADELKLPAGLDAQGKNRTRNFTLAEARQWIRHVQPFKLRPTASAGATLCVANFKGGVGKTVITAALAQGLSLRGYKVLCIDYDPQGSLTSLLGLIPTDVSETDTVAALTYPRNVEGASDTLQHCIQSTYWDGIDLIPGCHGLFEGEFYLPLRQMHAHRNEPGFQFYDVLNKALDAGIREEYDFVLIDTPPSLSYMTLTAFYASDALLMPLPPEGIDFASSGQFWSTLHEVSTANEAVQKKRFSWIRVVPSKVDNAKLHTNSMRELMKGGYDALLASTEIPETAAVRVGGARLESVYDISKYVGDRRTLLRARESYDKLVNEVDFLTHQNVWGGARG